MLPENAADQDEFDLDQDLRDPAFAAAYADATARYDLLEALADARKAAALTQTALAKAINTTQSAVSAIESGGTDPRLSTLQRYARGVGLALHWDLVPAGAELTKVQDVRYLPVSGRTCYVRTVIHQQPPAPAAVSAGPYKVIPSRVAG